MLISNHSRVQLIIGILKHYKIKTIVICPGSRNAPFIVSFKEDPWFNVYVIVDERSAAYFAMGNALKENTPTVLVCTSGTAAANFYPATIESYFQQTPLIVITADRPEYLENRWDGQMINQKGLFDNHIKCSVNLSESLDKKSISHDMRCIDLAVYTSLNSPAGPVHLNVPFTEPLYDKIESSESLPIRSVKRFSQFTVSPGGLDYVKSALAQSEKKMIVIGQSHFSEELNSNLERILEWDNNIVVVAEAISNVITSKAIRSIDEVLGDFSQHESTDAMPDTLLFFGGALVSKKFKSFISSANLRECIYVGAEGNSPDPFFSLTVSFQCQATDFIDQLAQCLAENKAEANNSSPSFANRWRTAYDNVKLQQSRIIDDSLFSEIKILSLIFDQLPKNSVVHLGNSLPVRLADKVPHHASFKYLSNRGTGGIDGCLSTAAGYALLSDQPNFIVLGDLSFFYDSNALCIKDFPSNLIIIILNNRGGGIFRTIPGAKNEEGREKFLAARHAFDAEKLAGNFHFSYFSAHNEKELNQLLTAVTSSDNAANNAQPKIIEIFPNE